MDWTLYIVIVASTATLGGCLGGDRSSAPDGPVLPHETLGGDPETADQTVHEGDRFALGPILIDILNEGPGVDRGGKLRTMRFVNITFPVGMEPFGHGGGEMLDARGRSLLVGTTPDLRYAFTAVHRCPIYGRSTEDSECHPRYSQVVWLPEETHWLFGVGALLGMAAEGGRGPPPAMDGWNVSATPTGWMLEPKTAPPRVRDVPFQDTFVGRSWQVHRNGSIVLRDETSSGDWNLESRGRIEGVGRIGEPLVDIPPRTLYERPDVLPFERDTSYYRFPFTEALRVLESEAEISVEYIVRAVLVSGSEASVSPDSEDLRWRIRWSMTVDGVDVAPRTFSVQKETYADLVPIYEVEESGSDDVDRHGTDLASRRMALDEGFAIAEGLLPDRFGILGVVDEFSSDRLDDMHYLYAFEPDPGAPPIPYSVIMDAQNGELLQILGTPELIERFLPYR